MSEIARARYEELLDILGEPHSPNQTEDDQASADRTASLKEYFSEHEAVLSVLGVDIYGYSRFEADPQRLVPVAFEWILRHAIQLAASAEPLLFPSYYDLKTSFIPTGDGGFLMFSTPLHAVAFAAYFQAVIDGYNSGFYYPQLLALVGPLTLRYSLTRDTVCHLDNNWFGPAIISNARIMAKDALNRFLLDAFTVKWFVERLGTVESLAAVVVSALPNLLHVPAPPACRSLLFSSASDDAYNLNAFASIHVQRIGVVSSKAHQIDLYNLCAQVRLQHQRIAPSLVSRNVVITIGNLNTAGISV